MTNDRRILKKVSLAFAAAFALILILLGITYCVSRLVGGRKYDYAEKQDDIYYFSADYESDPLDDEVYAAKDRQVFFTDASGFGEYLTETDGELSTVRGLIYRYFEAVNAGDAEGHKRLLTDSYKRVFAVPDRFAPQKLYDINVRFMSGGEDGGVYYERYGVSYKIYKNDGTFRADVGSDIAKMLVFEVVYKDGAPLINSVVLNKS